MSARNKAIDQVKKKNYVIDQEKIQALRKKSEKPG